MTQTVTVRIGNGDAVTVTTQAGTFVATGNFGYTSNPARVTVELAPSETNFLTVQAHVRRTSSSGCPYGGYTLSTTSDRTGAPLVIVQQGGATATTTPTSSPSSTKTRSQRQTEPSQRSPFASHLETATPLTRQRRRLDAAAAAGRATIRDNHPWRPAVEIGYSLSTEEHPPRELVRQAARAEEAGFDFAMISDHYHPWTDSQGNSPFAWSVLGGAAMATKRMKLGTGVTCPIIRYHPALVAQMAATVAEMSEGRFFLGVGALDWTFWSGMEVSFFLAAWSLANLRPAGALAGYAVTPGLSDVFGNVSEWTDTWHFDRGELALQASPDLAILAGVPCDLPKGVARSAGLVLRMQVPVTQAQIDTGFRCARSVRVPDVK